MRKQVSIVAIALGAVLALGTASATPAQAGSTGIGYEAGHELPVEQVGFKKHGHRKHIRKRHGGKFLFRFGKRNVHKNHARRGHFHKGYGHHHHRHGHRAHRHDFGHGHSHGQKQRVFVDPTFQFIFR